MALTVLGGLLVMIGFFVELIGTAGLTASSTLTSIQNYEEASYALLGVGFFLAFLGLVFGLVSIQNRGA